MQERSGLSFEGQVVYVGMDVHVGDWTVCARAENGIERRYTQSPGDAQAVVRYLRKHFPGADFVCAYEASCMGFWPQRAMEAAGVACIVVHAVDVPTTNRERRRRNDRRDARKLSHTLGAGALEALYVPTVQQEQDRALVRARRQLVSKQTRCKNQITAQLRFYGIQAPEDLRRSRWSRRYMTFLDQLEFSEPSGRAALHLLLSELRYLMSAVRQATKNIMELSRTPRYRLDVDLIRTAPGMSYLSAMIFLTETMDLRRFRGLDQLCSYAGFVPDEDSSGEEVKILGLTKRRNPHLRHILIQAAWASLRKDPVLANKYRELAATKTKGQKCKAIVSIARKLLSRVRRILLTREPYVLGLVA